MLSGRQRAARSGLAARFGTWLLAGFESAATKRRPPSAAMERNLHGRCLHALISVNLARLCMKGFIP
jgi:hypothetical protein